jgi:hypothetical protein
MSRCTPVTWYLPVAFALLACSKTADSASAPAESQGLGSAVAAPAPAARVAPSTAPMATKSNLVELCAGICLRAQELKCEGAAHCASLCVESMSEVPCPAEMTTATRCMLQHPASDWTCTPEGLASIRDGICEQEQQSSGAASGLPWAADREREEPHA